jgi:hypothetical protein
MADNFQNNKMSQPVGWKGEIRVFSLACISKNLKANFKIMLEENFF